MKIPEANGTVSAAAALDLIDLCREVGVVTDDILDELDITLKPPALPEARIPETSFIQLWRRLDQSDINEGLGIQLGQMIKPESKGILASWISQANTLREALEIFISNIPLMNPSEHWKIVEGKHRCKLTFYFNEDKAYPTIATERSMVAMVAWASSLSGNTFSLEEASFSFPAPNYIEQFKPIFGNKLEFGAASNSLTFKTALLDLAILSGNQLLKSIMAEQAKKTLKELAENTPIASKVKKLIEEALTRGNAISVQQVCATLGLSRQTLYRQLQAEHTDFKSLLDATRKERAIQLIENQKHNINSVALQLGYKDTSSFYKAFKRWTGSSPSSYSRKLFKNAIQDSVSGSSDDSHLTSFSPEWH